MKQRLESARALAISILARVESTEAYLNVVIDSQLSENRFSDTRDTALVTELCYGTIRRKLTIDSVLAQFSSQKLEALEDRVLAGLRIGAYQLYYSRIPARAVVAATVDAMKEVGLERAAGYVNAVLRKLTSLESIPLPPVSNRSAYLSIKESHPRWLVDRWIRQFGPDRAEQMLQANNEPPPLVIRSNRTKIQRDELLAQLGDAGLEVEATRFSGEGIRLKHPGTVDQLYGYREGLWQVQDEAAQLVVQYSDFAPDTCVIDACAAPGGKACQLAETHSVKALDIHGHKLSKIQVEARRLEVSKNIQIYAQDARNPFPESWNPIYGILVDAPCSGLGTLRRHPELRYRRAPEDFARLTHLQREILENCQQALEPGGLLTYAVCSTDPEEGADQIEMFLRSHPEFTAEPPAHLDEKPWPRQQSYLRTLPGPEGFDGFFAARLRKLY